MKIEWRSKYQIGIEAIDNQHKYFLELISRINEQLYLSPDAETIKRFMNELIKYAEFHFCSEENIMYFEKYPGLKIHHNLHSEILTQLHERMIFSDIALDLESMKLLVQFLIDWFSKHTIEEDKAFADFLKNKEV
ncbi:MAG: bacteriohemerythrin [Spirochaetia bacterium]|nr:bacteriohemerythrin [Spirochaetia bacterium]